MISRINLLMRRMDSISRVFQEADNEMEDAAREVMGLNADYSKVPRR
jgi:phage-related tail protein